MHLDLPISSRRSAAWSLLLAAAFAAAAGTGRAATLDAPTVAIDSAIVQFAASGGATLSGPLGIAIDVAGQEIVVANTGGRRLEFYGFDGRPTGSVRHLVSDAEGHRVEGMPRAVAVCPNGDLFVSDVAVPWVERLDFRGRTLDKITLPAPDDRLETGGAGALARTGDGRLFVASRARAGRVYVFDADGRLLAAWGASPAVGATPGVAPAGQLSAITGLATLGDSEVVVTCIGTALAVQVFDAAGRYLRGFGEHDIGPGRFSQPTGVTVTADGRIWVVDSVRSNLQVFDSAGGLVSVLAGHDAAGDWLAPSAVAGDGHGLFAVAELGGNRFRLLRVQNIPGAVASK